MRTIVSLISAFAFLLHMWLGCCAHHGHEHAAFAVAGHASVASCSHAGHDHAGGSAGEESSHDPHATSQHGPTEHDSPGQCPGEHGQGCQDGECVFLCSGKTTLAKDSPALVLPLLASDAAGKPLATLQASAIDTGGLPPLAVRLHLLHQVYLS